MLIRAPLESPHSQLPNGARMSCEGVLNAELKPIEDHASTRSLVSEHFEVKRMPPQDLACPKTLNPRSSATFPVATWRNVQKTRFRTDPVLPKIDTPSGAGRIYMCKRALPASVDVRCCKPGHKLETIITFRLRRLRRRNRRRLKGLILNFPTPPGLGL